MYLRPDTQNYHIPMVNLESYARFAIEIWQNLIWKFLVYGHVQCALTICPSTVY